MIYLRKKLLRREMLDKLSKMDEKKHKKYSQIIVNRFINSSFYKEAKTIMSFVSFGHEINTHDLIKNSLLQGKKILVPITIPEKRELKVSQLKDFDELELGHYNILTPKDEYIRLRDPLDIDLIIVPGLAFDKKGFRVGYGGGYYDRFLAQLPQVTKISLAFHMQTLPQLPRENFDIPVDYIYTERGIIECK